MTQKKEWFERELQHWLARWLEDEVIDEAQREAMLSSVRDAEASAFEAGEAVTTNPLHRLSRAAAVLRGGNARRKKKSVVGWLPALLISLATVLLGVGVMLFYAANWRRMPPGFKLFQVFCLVLGSYAGGYYLTVVKQTAPRVGRALLILGMVSFGAGISLIAQIYHISAHPANGVLVWCLGVIAMAWVIRERWGGYLALLLCFIWTTWEFSVYSNPNWLLPLVAAVLIVLFVRLRERAGITLTVLLGLIWLLEAEALWLKQHVHFRDEVAFLLIVMCFPLGVCLVAIGRWLEGRELYHWTSRVMAFLGWLAMMVPILGLSWPTVPKLVLFPFLLHDVQPLAMQYATLMGIAAVLLVLLARVGRDASHLTALLVVGLLFVAVPYGDIRVLMTFSHVLLLAFLFGFLYVSYRYHKAYSLERFLAISFVLIAMFSKYVGFTVLGLKGRSFYVAYVLGFVIFGTVCFLANQLVRLALQRHEVKFPVGIISSFSALLGYVCFYSLTFKFSPQHSVMQAKAYILILLFAFIGLSVLLYLYLLKNGSDALILKLSAGAFGCTVAMMFLSGPALSWNVYAIVFNILLFVMIGVLIAYSVQINSKWLANLAIAGFLLQMVTRYFDLLWDMFSGSVLFIVTGLLVLAGGYFLERSRRRLLSSIEQNERQAATGGSQ